MFPSPEWTPSDHRPCASCGTVVEVVSEVGTCPLCWAQGCGADPDQALGQAIAVEALLFLDTAPQRVTACVQRLWHLSEHATRPAVTAVLCAAALDLEAMVAE